MRRTDLASSGGSPILVIDCGYATATDDHTYWNKTCGPTGFPCPPVPGVVNPHQFMTVISLQQRTAPIAAWCAGGDAPMPSQAALRDQIIRLLRPPAIGVSPDTGTSLVNLKMLFWIPTATTVALGKAALVGFPVELRVLYDHTDFDFGDGATGSLQPGPGTAYSAAADCGACSDRFGHAYTEPGPVTVTARVFWQAQFRIAGQPWVTLPDTVTANQPATTTFVVKESKAVLVAPG